ncbi:GlsB/YeaQ/YmgE family stress response membrane protein [Paeniglutamicibacter antarcticus]|uniref:GlsB/YeaQ/YmgE family stress response membrane protein n=1 Tax=Arthrobacter terrae TaxID=2935737 RepID=A0A931G7I4_9MICC|nr:GlsB/YeaQ/YmgE family stress response membrane protein [Arthrobacter terrae]MBG0739334.1 GlsB/YeaQ/YmgE family stress response membrane protein [Arthrobacter terrae]
MGFIGWIILGLIVGAIVKAVMPGRVGGGWITSLVLGVVGAIVGGWISGLVIGQDAISGFFNLGTWIFAIIGGFVVAGIYGMITGRNKSNA